MGPLFYTSYAASAGDRGRVQRFHTDVQNELYSRLGRQPSGRGRLKQPEPAPVSEPAVLDCRSMLALYSDAYLSGEDSVREWSIFHERMARHTRQTGRESQALVGVVWRAAGLVLPRAITDVGPLLPGRGAGYPAADVDELMRDPAHWDGYRRLVREVADRLSAGAAVGLPQMSEIDAKEVVPEFAADPRAMRLGGDTGPGAFARVEPVRDPSARVVADDRRSDRAGTSPRRVTLALLAGTRQRMAGLRNAVATYGETAQDWRPFRPQTDEPAVDVVRRALFAYGIDDVRVRVLDDEPGAEPDRLPGRDPDADSVTLVLVDPWLAREGGFPAAYERLAHWPGTVAGVVAILPRGDQETWQSTWRLRAGLLADAENCAVQAPRHEVGSAEGLAHIAVGAVADVFGGNDPTPDAFAVATPKEPVTLARPESPTERLVRRRKERAAWIARPTRSPLASMMYGSTGGTWSEGDR
jgi:FxsC-like protein